MKLNKKQVEMKERLERYNLFPEQLDFIMSDFCKGKALEKRITSAIDQAIRYKNINEGKMVRDFAFIYKGDCSQKRGVYRVSFGDKFYIGRAKCIKDRFNQHKRTLKKFFTDGEYPEDHFMKKVFEHLKEDKHTYFFIVELMEQAYTVESLVEKEQKWLDKYKDDPRCLNNGFIATKVPHEIEESFSDMKERKRKVVVFKRGNRLVFLNKDKKYHDELLRKESGYLKHDKNKKAVADGVDWGIPLLVEGYVDMPSVYKLYYGDYFIIVKSKELSGGIYMLQRNYGYYLGYDKNIYDKGKNYNALFYDTIRDHPGLPFRLEIVLQSNSAYELLVAEQDQLTKNGRNKKCKNSNVEAYVNKFNEKTGMYNWMEAAEVEKFYEYLSKPLPASI